jgi:hypothetical protein
MGDSFSHYHLANPHCSICFGFGITPGRPLAAGQVAKVLCRCVRRRIFHIILNRIHVIRESESFTQVTYKTVEYRAYGAKSLAGSFLVYGILNLEFIADFESLAHRTLSQIELPVFRLHYLEEKNYKVCTQLLRLSRGNFFHICYRIEEKLGLSATTLTPYPLFPISDYFDQRLNRITRITSGP